MADRKEIYADGIGKLNFAAGMVQFDFVTLQPGADGQNPVPESCFFVKMPVQGYLSAFDSMQKLIDKLLEAGVLAKNEAAASAAAPAPAAEAPASEAPAAKSAAEEKTAPKKGRRKGSKAK